MVIGAGDGVDGRRTVAISHFTIAVALLALVVGPSRSESAGLAFFRIVGLNRHKTSI